MKNTYITFTSHSGVHTVTVDGITHIFSEAEDALDDKTALQMAWDFIAVVSYLRGDKHI